MEIIKIEIINNPWGAFDPDPIKYPYIFNAYGEGDWKVTIPLENKSPLMISLAFQELKKWSS